MPHQQAQNRGGYQKPALNLSKLLSNGWHLRGKKQWQAAAAICQKVLASSPANGEAWHLLGLLSWDQSDPEQAVKHLKKAILVEPQQPLHLNNLGVVLNDIKSHSEAGIYLKKALEIAPGYLDAKCNFGLSLFHQNKLDQAAQLFTEILSDEPKHSAALANLALLRMAQHDYASAIAHYQKAIAIDPSHSHWHGNLGAAYEGSGETSHAAACYRQALDLAPNDIHLAIRLAIALRTMGRLMESVTILKTALSNDPNHSEALVNLVIAYEQTCQWDKLDPLYDQLDQSTKKALIDGELPSEDPMLNIRRSDDLALNRAVSQAWSQTAKSIAQRLAKPFTHHQASWTERPITVGYLSYDFRNHPVAHQLTPLFALHDRNHFKILAFSMGPDDKSVYRSTIKNNCDTFFDIGSCNLVDAAQTIYDQKVDILIDLMGHSHHNRLGILALHPAPIQVGYLGFLSTTGADFIDYIIADEVVAPEDHRDFFSEQLLQMPTCYQLNHTLQRTAGPDYKREDFNLPSKGFIFCCFNVAYKIDRSLFDGWMRILGQIPDSVLWLFGSNPLAMEHMCARARQIGIDPERLVFAEQMPLEEHLRRLPLADLALDTLRYNGGATTANALRVGLPVLTSTGNHWVSRMSASHLRSAGLPQLITRNLEAYVDRAISLASDPNQLLTIRNKLSQQIETQPLFDPGSFVRTLENGYQAIWQRYLSGKGPIAIKLPMCSEMHHLKPVQPILSE